MQPAKIQILFITIFRPLNEMHETTRNSGFIYERPECLAHETRTPQYVITRLI